MSTSAMQQTEQVSFMGLCYRASDFFQDWLAKVTHGAKMMGHFLK